MRDFLPKADLLPYLEAILHVYNLHGRRDNKYKARIKILLHEEGLENIRAQVEEIFLRTREGFQVPSDELIDGIETYFRRPDLTATGTGGYQGLIEANPAFRSLTETNVAEHTNPAYGIVTISLKPIGGTPGDATSEQMRVVADLAERYGHDEIRVSHEQNLILPHIAKADILDVYAALRESWTGHRQYRADLRHHRLPRHGLLRAGDGALDPDSAGDLYPLRRA